MSSSKHSLIYSLTNGNKVKAFKENLTLALDVRERKEIAGLQLQGYELAKGNVQVLLKSRQSMLVSGIILFVKQNIMIDKNRLSSLLLYHLQCLSQQLQFSSVDANSLNLYQFEFGPYIKFIYCNTLQSIIYHSFTFNDNDELLRITKKTCFLCPSLRSLVLYWRLNNVLHRDLSVSY